MRIKTCARELRPLQIAFVAVLIVGAFLATQGIAYGGLVGAEFSAPTPTPGAYLSAKPTWISVRADAASPILAATMSINGVPVPAYMDYPIGHFVYDEEQETDIWVADDFTVVKVITYNIQSRVVDGANTVRTTVTSGVGTSEYSWTFNYGTASSVSSVSPASGAILPDSPSAIVARLSSPSASFTATMVLDGAPVETAYDPATKSFTHSPEATLSAGIHKVAFTAKDSANGLATRSWSFTVSPPMSTGWDCAVCHSGYDTAHPMAGCEDCHDHGYAPPNRHGSAVPTVAGCTSDGILNPFGACHRFDHGGEAGRGANGFDCVYCHDAEFPGVPRHFNEAALTVSLATPTNGCFGGTCHTRNLILEHAKYPRASALKYQCDLCHRADAPQRVKDAIATKSMECFACHEGFHEE